MAYSDERLLSYQFLTPSLSLNLAMKGSSLSNIVCFRARELEQ